MEDAIATLFCLCFVRNGSRVLYLRCQPKFAKAGVCQRSWTWGGLAGQATTSVHRGMVLSHPSTHSLRCFCLRLKCWRYMFYISRLKRGQRLCPG